MSWTLSGREVFESNGISMFSVLRTLHVDFDHSCVSLHSQQQSVEVCQKLLPDFLMIDIIFEVR